MVRFLVQTEGWMIVGNRFGETKDVKRVAPMSMKEGELQEGSNVI
jgi:hypothetical protein